MRIAIPQDSERFGAVLIHSVQQVWELDASLKQKKEKPTESDVICRISYEELHDIEQQMAIVVPMQGERIKLVEGVLCGIPNHCLVIIASNSGAESHPAWYHNLISKSVATIEVGVDQFNVYPSIAQEPERTHLYDKMVEMMPIFEKYRRETTREIPVILLTPVK